MVTQSRDFGKAQTRLHLHEQKRVVAPSDQVLRSTASKIASISSRVRNPIGDTLEHSLDQVIDDDILRLIFTACHPVLTVEARIIF